MAMIKEFLFSPLPIMDNHGCQTTGVQKPKDPLFLLSTFLFSI